MQESEQPASGVLSAITPSMVDCSTWSSMMNALFAGWRPKQVLTSGSQGLRQKVCKEPSMQTTDRKCWWEPDVVLRCRSHCICSAVKVRFSVASSHFPGNHVPLGNYDDDIQQQERRKHKALLGELLPTRETICLQLVSQLHNFPSEFPQPLGKTPVITMHHPEIQ